MRVLLADDDVEMLDVTSYALRKYGHDVTCVTDGADVVAQYKKSQPEVVILDVNLPHTSGMDLCRSIRAQWSTPIIMVTAMSDERHVLEGLESGADDYMCKPISYKELAVRMRAVAGRHAGIQAGSGALTPSSVVRSGDLTVDISTCEVYKAGIPVRMTRLEARVLYFLLASAGHVIPTARLIDRVWEYNGGDGFSLKTHICHVRGKLGILSGKPGYIVAVPHIGYKLEA
jgi:DNA-binding response OmpR family regulator